MDFPVSRTVENSFLFFFFWYKLPIFGNSVNVTKLVTFEPIKAFALVMNAVHIHPHTYRCSNIFPVSNSSGTLFNKLLKGIEIKDFSLIRFVL